MSSLHIPHPTVTFNRTPLILEPIMITARAVIIQALALASSSGAAFSQLSYSIADLGHLTPNGLTKATGINAAGEISLTTLKNTTTYYPLGAKVPASGGWPISLGLHPNNGTRSSGLGINDLGHIIGEVNQIAFPGVQSVRPAMHDGASWKILQPQDNNGQAYAINNAGQVAGTFMFQASPSVQEPHAAILGLTTFKDLGTLGGKYGIATAINSQGHVAGLSTLPSGAVRAFAYTGTAMLDLGTLGGNASEAWGINDSTHVVGWSHNPDGVRRAFFYDHSTALTEDIGTLGTSSEARDINNTGIIVGHSWVVGQGPHAFARLPLTGMTDLNDLIPAGTGWTLQYATALNDSGVIVGYGRLNGVLRGFKLTPEPPCAADCDGDGTTTIDDFICFQTLFALGDPAADCDKNGSLSIDDFICFQTLFAIGC